MKKYYQAVNKSHIKKYCQIYTNTKIADFMIDWLMKSSPTCIYDPAFGMGAFYYAAKKKGFNGIFRGSEIDTISFNYFHLHVKKTKKLLVLNEDYFDTWSKNSFPCIVCNPPYSKFQNISNRKIIFQKLQTLLGIKISGFTNLASAFLMKAVYELADNGRLAFLMPSEFLNTGYGEKVKEYLLNNGSIDNIIQIEDEKGSFNSVTTTVCIVLFIKNKSKQSITFSKINDISNIKVVFCNTIKLQDISIKEKWQKYFEKEKHIISNSNFVPLSFYGKFVRGIATGANEFFILNSQNIKKYKLSNDEVSICITKSNQIKTSILDNQTIVDKINKNDNIFILNLNNKTNLSQQVKTYIEYGELQGYHQRYLTKNRKPWYLIENRNPSPILFGVFTREKLKIIRNYTNAKNLTCFHGFNLKQNFASDIIDKLFIYLKSKRAENTLISNRRIYGNNLTKFEPNDLNSMLVPTLSMFNKFEQRFVKREMKHILLHNCLSEEGNKYIDTL